MRLPFVKLQGLGNDFVFFDGRANELDFEPATVMALCDRHTGIGADGVIIVKQSLKPDCTAFMRYFNSDGSVAAMCGNGIRCFAKYLVDRAIVDPASGSLTADTPAGKRRIAFEVDAESKLTRATVDMGKPILNPAAIPVKADADGRDERIGEPFVKSLKLDSPWGPWTFTCVSMGNPHAVCFIDDWNALPSELFDHKGKPSLATFDVAKVGAYFEAHPAFPEKTNVEFATVAPDGIAMRVFERGCGETMACGTGACATLVAAVLNGLSETSNSIHLLGGTLSITWTPGDTVMMAGPAAESFTGEVTIPELG